MANLQSDRLQYLRDNFNASLRNALVRTDEQSFRRCFPGFDEQQIAGFYECYRQVLFQVRGNSQAEFDVICEEAYLTNKFMMLDQLCQQQRLTDDPDLARESEPAVKPSETVQSQRVVAKEAEVKELTLLLEGAKGRLEANKQELKMRQDRLQQTVDSFKPLLSSAAPVHEASKLWNDRQAGAGVTTALL